MAKTLGPVRALTQSFLIMNFKISVLFITDVFTAEFCRLSQVNMYLHFCDVITMIFPISKGKLCPHKSMYM